MTTRNTPSWQLILADLALILFLVTLWSLAGSEANGADEPAKPDTPQVSPAQSLFRPSPGGPTLAEWLAERPRDPRATLTIFVRHSGPDREEAWQRAEQLAGEAEAVGFEVRVVLAKAEESDLHASLAYDAPR